MVYSKCIEIDTVLRFEIGILKREAVQAGCHDDAACAVMIEVETGMCICTFSVKLNTVQYKLL